MTKQVYINSRESDIKITTKSLGYLLTIRLHLPRYILEKMLIGPTLSPHSPHSLPILYTTTARAALHPCIECVAPPCGHDLREGVGGIYSTFGVG